jgi:hypothetical protein
VSFHRFLLAKKEMAPIQGPFVLPVMVPVVVVMMMMMPVGERRCRNSDRDQRC